MPRTIRFAPKQKVIVLVTGVGGNIGQGIVKAIHMSNLRARIIGTDMNPLSAGLFRCDRGYVVRGCKDPAFLEEIITILKSEHVQLLLVGSDEEVEFFAHHRKAIELKSGAVVVVCDAAVSSVGYDKWQTWLFCRRKGIPYPDTVLGSDRKQLESLIRRKGFPLLIKPRVGYGSRNVYAVHDRRELEVFLKRVPDPIVQEIVGSDEQEYTAASFVTRDQEIVGTIIFRRLLSAGATYKAEVIRNSRMKSQVEVLIRKLQPLGPCNVQFRLVRGKILPFEFNIRFSGTTPIRSVLGFNDVEWAIRHFVFDQKVHPPKIQEGVAFRYWNEILVLGETFKPLRGLRKINPKQFKLTTVNAL